MGAITKPEIDFDGLIEGANAESVDALIDAVAYAKSLPEREQKILMLFCEGYTQAEIGAEVGLSTRQIRRIFKNMSALGRVVCIRIEGDE